MMKYKSYFAEVNYSAEDKVFHGKLIGIKALVNFEGDSVKSLEKAFREAVDDYLDFCEKLGKKPERTCSGNVTLRMEPQEHVQILLAAKKAGMSVNKFIAKAATEKAEHFI